MKTNKNKSVRAPSTSILMYFERLGLSPQKIFNFSTVWQHANETESETMLKTHYNHMYNVQ